MVMMFGLLILGISLLETTTVLASPQSDRPSRVQSLPSPASPSLVPGGGSMDQTSLEPGRGGMPNEYWKSPWRNNPVYGDYWQREREAARRRQWTQRAGVPPVVGYYPPAATAGPDSQYTYKTYNTPEYYGYDALFPGGRAHFIGYKTQGGRKLSPDWTPDQNARGPFVNSPVTESGFTKKPNINFT